MATIKTELCTDSKAEGVYPLSEYQFIDVKHEAVESVLKTEVKNNVDVYKVEPESCPDIHPSASFSDDRLFDMKEEELSIPACPSVERKYEKELLNVSNVESSVNPPIKDELHEELNIEEHEVKLDRKRAAAAGSDLCPRREDLRTVLRKTASSPSNTRRADMADQSRSWQAADMCVLETDLPGGQYRMVEEFTEKLIEKVREYIFLYDTGHPEYKNLVKKAEAWRDISKELHQTSETVKQKWKNLRDSYMKYKRFLNGTTGQATKKYEKWPWSRHLEFLDYTLTPRPTTSSVSDSQISETPLQEAGTPPSSQAAESSCPLSPAPLEMLPPPIKKLRKKQSTDDVDKLIGYLENKNKNKNQLDVIDHLFLSYAETFKQFPPRRQAMLKIELATLFACAEINELDAQTTPASSPHYSANSTGSGLTSDESNAPQDSTELTHADLSISTNLNNAYLLVQPK